MTSIVHTPTPYLPDSLDFYNKLNFKVLSKQKPVLLTDGKALIEINPDRFARAGVKLFAEDWHQTAQELEKVTAISKLDEGYLLSDPSGAWVYLMEGRVDIDLQLSEESYSVLGNYAGLSLETADIDKSTEIWEILGFVKSMGAIEQGWVTYKNDDEMTISLMKPNTCPHLFFNPSLTYFNGAGNLKIIQNIRGLNIPITEEITHFNDAGDVDNIIIRDPGGYGFFVFNDG